MTLDDIEKMAIEKGINFAIEQVRKAIVDRRLVKHYGNISEVARELQTHRQTVTRLTEVRVYKP